MKAPAIKAKSIIPIKIKNDLLYVLLLFIKVSSASANSCCDSSVINVSILSNVLVLFWESASASSSLPAILLSITSLWIFFTINLFDLRDQEIDELEKFHKSSFDVNNVFSTAEDLKYANQIKFFLSELFKDPGTDFINLIISHDIYNGRKNQAIVEKFRPIVKKSITQYINDLVNDRIKAALNQAQPNKQITQNTTTNSSPVDSEHINKISTIQEELEAFAIIKILLKDNIPLDKITYKDTESYFGILYDNNTWKWICRLILDSNKKYLILPDENRKPQKYSIKSVNDLFSYSDQLKKVVERYTSC